MEDTICKFANFIQSKQLSYLSGSLPTTSKETKLFVSNAAGNNDAHIYSFPFPSNHELETLYKNAQPAVFGRGQESVLDPAYRSARTLLNENFAINLRPSADLLDQIKKLMVNQNDDGNEFVRAELYRVNIYGPGDFFKEHQDTPQTGGGHFGSLVICLPTVFEGGEFALHDPQGKEVKFDWGKTYSTKLTADADAGCDGDKDGNALPPSKKIKASTTSLEDFEVEYVAFASDLTHWIEPVVSGYRVTVTFHLFKGTCTTPKSDSVPLCIQQQVQEVVKMNELRDKLSGSHIIFPLVHQYAERDGSRIVLKGGDATLFETLKYMKARPQIMFYYNEDTPAEEEENGEEEDTQLGQLWYLTESVAMTADCGFYDYDDCTKANMTELASLYRAIFAGSSNTTDMLLSVGGHYGNEASTEVYCGNACIFTTW